MIRLHVVSKRFDTGLLAIDDVDLVVDAGEIVAAIGPSGCGKSTVLRLVAGLENPTEGTVEVAGHRVTGPDRSVGLVFQEPRLFPWLTVEQNVAFGLGSEGEDKELAVEAIGRVGLGQFAHCLPKELSGGMAQRTAIARALVTKPPVLLLDEPFSALDAFTRVDLQEHLLEVWSWYRPTMLLVTHDIDEAIALADRIVVFGGRPGTIHSQVEVPLPRPRQRAASGFHALQDHVRSELGRLLKADRPTAAGVPGHVA